MPVLEPPTDDLTRRVTSDKLAPDLSSLENIIDPLADTSLFLGEDRSPGLIENPANKQPQQKSFRQEYRERREQKRNGAQPGQRELPKTKNQSAITPQDQQLIGQIEELVKNKKYGRALAMIAGNPKVRELMRSKVSEIRNQMALEAAKDRIKMLAQNAARSAIMDLLVVTSPWWEIILIIVLCIIALVIGIVILTNRPLDVPPGTVPLSGNEAGIYLKSSIMTPSMKVTDKPGTTNARTQELALEAVAGGWSPEEPAVPCGSAWCLRGKTETLALSSLFPEPVTQEDMDYYMTARFPYVHGANFDYRNSLDGPPRQGWAGKKSYAGKKLILFNPKTNKAVVGIAAEYGPAPWTGVCSDRDSETNNSSNKRIKASCVEQRKAWNEREVVAGPKVKKLPLNLRAYDISLPANYTGRIAGGEPKLRDKIGIQTDEVVIIGYATDQSLKPGTVLTIKEEDIIRTGSTTGSDTTNQIISAAREYLTARTFDKPPYSPCAKFVTLVLNDVGIMDDYERACVILNSLLSGQASNGVLTKMYPDTGSVESFDISKADDSGTNENTLLNQLFPGDIIIVTTASGFSANNHVAIYAGKKDGKHSIIHTTSVTNGVFAKRGSVAHTTIESIRPKENGPYDFWSAYSFRSWNGVKIDGSANN